MNPFRNMRTKLSTTLPRSFRPLALAALCAAGLAAAAVAPAPARAQADEPPVQTFPQEFRFLKGFWANEHVPAYRAPPAIHTWRMVTTHVTKDENSLATGTMTGLYSSATTWTDFEQWYQVVLHCTTEEALAYHS